MRELLIPGLSSLLSLKNSFPFFLLIFPGFVRNISPWHKHTEQPTGFERLYEHFGGEFVSLFCVGHGFFGENFMALWNGFELGRTFHSRSGSKSRTHRVPLWLPERKPPLRTISIPGKEPTGFPSVIERPLRAPAKLRKIFCGPAKPQLRSDLGHPSPFRPEL